MTTLYLYSHDGDGLGHLRRNVNIAQAATDRLHDCSALLLTGSVVPGAFGIPERCDHIKIPTLMKTGAGEYLSPLTMNGNGPAHELRSALLELTVRKAPPDMLVVDRHPQGLHGELIPALRWLREHSPRTRLVLGLRDVLDDPTEAEREWRADGSLEVIRDLYDRVWIYTDERICSTADLHNFPPELRDKCTTCGYLVAKTPRAQGSPSSPPCVVATVGGGRDGRAVLEDAAAAVAGLRSSFGDLRLRLFAGPLMPAEAYLQLRERVDSLGSWVKIERFSDRLLRIIRGAVAVVTMGGYNSLLECVAMGKPTVVVPRESPRTEQLIRARVFEALGYVRVARRGDPDGLADHIAAILERRWTPAPASRINLRGYQRVLEEIRSAAHAGTAARCERAVG